VANISTKIIEFFEDIAGTEMGLFGPEQIQDHATLAAQTHAKIPATPIDIFNAFQRGRRSCSGVSDGQTRSGEGAVDHSKQEGLQVQL
jgi:hypothetical protein